MHQQRLQAQQTRNFAVEPVHNWRPPAYSDRVEFDAAFVGMRHVNKQADFLERNGTPVAKWSDVPHKTRMDKAMFHNPRSTDVLSK